MLRRVDRIFLRVPAIPGAIHYYRDVLGMKLLQHDQRSASFLMSDGQTEIVLRADADQQAEQICYLVDDVRDLYARRSTLQLKFVQQPRQTARGYFAAVRDPFGNVLTLLDRSAPAAGANVAEDGAAPATLFPGVESAVPAKRMLLIDLYQQAGRTADDLPYTPDFERIFDAYAQRHSDPKPTRREVWRHLLNLRKAGNLPKLGDARNPSPKVSAEAEIALRQLLAENIGRRDRLPYTDRFDKLVDDFNRSQSRPLSPHLVWRLVAKLAK
jgi:catechol 2,3-dioxygenase-like lactoylglutathione lyase family enzyme